MREANTGIRMEVPYFQVPNDIFRAGLTTSELAVYFYLARCGNQGNAAFPSYSEIASSCSITKKTAIKVIKQLEAKKLIVKQRRWSKNQDEYFSNVYIVEHAIPVDELREATEREKQEKARLRQIGRVFIDSCRNQGAEIETTPELEEDIGRELEEASAEEKKKKKWAYAGVE
jgi:DNA-binding transcriptional regulator YhcF (GntR family)